MSEQELITTEDQEMFQLATLPAALQAKIAAASQRLKDSAQITINKIRLDAKTFILPDGTETQAFTGIIIAVKHCNIHYSGSYEEGKSNPVDCFAILEGEADASNGDLTPHSEVMMPYCAGTCASCHKLQWGSDGGGKKRGKECSEHVLIAVYVPSVGEDFLLLEAKKANAKIADGYLTKINSKFGHTVTIYTRFSMGEKTKWTQDFLAASPVSGELIANLANRFDEANLMLAARAVDAYKRGVPVENSDPYVPELEEGRKPRER